jgi:hypothetical protein
VAAFISRRASNDPGSQHGFPRNVAVLSLMQVGGFLLLEAIERAVSGGSLLTIASDRVVLLGSVLQLVAAVLGALLLIALGAAVDRVAAALRSVIPALEIGSAWSTAPDLRPATTAVAAGGRGLRGPPLRS